ncbi:MAG: aconitase family protein, partial [Acidimicrobiia bacterium]
LSQLEPLIALPSSPGHVVPVREVAGAEVFQCVIGSSANPGLRDFAIAALIVDGKQTHERVSFDVNPTSRQTLEALDNEGYLFKLIAAGARIHQAGCMGCIGMGQAPATGRISLRTMPRNFPGRSGTAEDQVYLCSPETAAASALTGVITDPRDLEMPYPRYQAPTRSYVNTAMLVAPPRDGRLTQLVKGPNIASLPDFEELPETIAGPVLLKMGDNVSTDEILPAGAEVLPLRSNIPAISRFAFSRIDETYHDRALVIREAGGHVVVGGANYGQGSSREHAAIAPRYLGLHAVIAKGFARIHAQNLVNFGVLPISFLDPADYDRMDQGDEIVIPHAAEQIRAGSDVVVENRTKGETYRCTHKLSSRQVDLVAAGSLISFLRNQVNPI